MTPSTLAALLAVVTAAAAVAALPAVAALLAVVTAVAARGAVRSLRHHAVRRRVHGLARAPGRGGLLSVLDTLPEPPAWLGPRLESAGVGLAPAAAWWGWMAALGLLAVAALVVGGLPAAVLAVVFGALAPLVVLRARRGLGDTRLERALPGALEAVARSLRSGASLRQAIAEAAEATPGGLGRELALVAAQVDHGSTLVAALEGMATRRPVPGVRLAVAALCLGVETGGAQARAVDGVAATLRDRLAIAAEVRALSSQARVSALVIGLAPLAFGGFAVATDPRTAEFVFRTPLGLTILAVGIGLDAAGWLWMQRLARVPA